MTGPILLVDDDDNDVFFLQEAFKAAGVKNPLHVASDGQQAISYFKGEGKFSQRADFPLPLLVLLDLKLPLVMGLDVLQWIRQHSEPARIVIIFSASQEPEDIAAAYRIGANAYLVKPSDTSELLDIVMAIKAFWLTYAAWAPI